MSRDLWLESDLSLRFGSASEHILKFSVKSSARRIAVCGPSGSGKSTFLKVLAGVEKRALGILRVGGQVWQDSQSDIFVPSLDRRVGWVPQNALLFPHLNVEKNLLFSPSAPRMKWREVSEQLQIEHLLSRKPRNLSGGERSRVALARALLASPGVLLLDEPLSSLNDSLREEVLLFLKRHCEKNEVSLIMATHHHAEARFLCEEVLDWGIARQAGVSDRSKTDAFDPKSALSLN
jgi:molybdate transport system ATP-binding protein